MFFSIIIPTYNSEKVISICLESIKNQTFNDYEILVMDGFSSDRTIEIASSFAIEDKRIKWVSEKDSGVYDAMNKGIKMAKGEWIYFLGADDYLVDENVLAQVSAFILENSNDDIVYGSVTSSYLGEKYDGAFDALKLTRKNLCHQAIFYKANVFNLLGPYNLKYKVNADWEFNLRCFFHPKINTKYIDMIIAYFSGGGLSDRIGDPLFNAEWNQIVANIGYRSMPLKNLKLFCRSNLEFCQLILRRFYYNLSNRA